eukprot:3631370-Pleurochrysis_carterae.AAC.1
MQSYHRTAVPSKPLPKQCGLSLMCSAPAACVSGFSSNALSTTLLGWFAGNCCFCLPVQQSTCISGQVERCARVYEWHA